jgi:hypothetical protein
MPEMKAARSLLERARQGIHIYAKSVKEMLSDILKLSEKSG